jgi:fructose-specific phosphotransferase system component IIB
MKNKNTLYFIHNTTIKNTNFDKLALDDTRLMWMADLVVSNNVKLKDRQRGQGDVISDKSIMEEIATFDGIIISRPDKRNNQDRQASEEFIQSQVKRYINNQNNIADPIIDRIALELHGLYPKLSKEHSVDWALEFINTDDNCEEIFKRIDELFLPVNVTRENPRRYVSEQEEVSSDFETFFKTA